MKFLLDVNMPPQLSENLVTLGHQARHASKVGLLKATDLQLIEIAKKENEVIITHDLDFGQLLAFTGYTFPSVVIYRIHHLQVELLIELFELHWTLIQQPLNEGSIVIVEEEKLRIKKLPI